MSIYCIVSELLDHQFLPHLLRLNTCEKNKQIRQSYNAMVSASWENEFKAIAASIHSKDQSISYSLSQRASAARDTAKSKAREENSFVEKLFLSGRDYFTAPKESSKNSEQSFYSAFKTGGGDLGLENNGFGNTLEAWKILKKCGINDVYPEMINADPETVANFTSKFVGSCPTSDDILELAGIQYYEEERH